MIIADTGFWLALANSKDRHHAAARRALGELAEPLISTWLVVGETCHLLATRLGVDAELRFLDGVSRGALQVFQLELEHLPRILELTDKYRSLPMDLADASLVILAEELGSGRILSTDTRDFRTYRWKSRKPFHNLLEL
jgi:predicted nucleic acid-binding protein